MCRAYWISTVIFSTRPENFPGLGAPQHLKLENFAKLSFKRILRDKPNTPMPSAIPPFSGAVFFISNRPRAVLPVHSSKFLLADPFGRIGPVSHSQFLLLEFRVGVDLNHRTGQFQGD